MQSSQELKRKVFLKLNILVKIFHTTVLKKLDDDDLRICTGVHLFYVKQKCVNALNSSTEKYTRI